MPSTEWVDSNVPQIIRENSIPLHATELPSSEDLSLETLMQAHVYIIAGAMFVTGISICCQHVQVPQSLEMIPIVCAVNREVRVQSTKESSNGRI